MRYGTYGRELRRVAALANVLRQIASCLSECARRLVSPSDLVEPFASVGALCITTLIAWTPAQATVDRLSVPTQVSAGSYIIDMGNASPTMANALRGDGAADTLPVGVTMAASWACTATAGGSCSAASGGAVGDGLINLTVNLPANGTATITIPAIYSNDPRAF